MSSSAQWLGCGCNVALHHANGISFLPTDQWPAACSRRPPQPAQQLQWSWPAAPYYRQLGAGHLQPHGAPACHGDPEETREKGNPHSMVFLLGKLPPQLSFINFNLDECTAKRWEPPGGHSCFALRFSCQWYGSPGRQFMITLAPSNCVTVKGLWFLTQQVSLYCSLYPSYSLLNAFGTEWGNVWENALETRKPFINVHYYC